MIFLVCCGSRFCPGIGGIFSLNAERILERAAGWVSFGGAGGKSSKSLQIT